MGVGPHIQRVAAHPLGRPLHAPGRHTQLFTTSGKKKTGSCPCHATDSSMHGIYSMAHMRLLNRPCTSVHSMS